MKEILLNPGPVTLSPGVRAAAIRSDLCHREPEFIAAQSAVISGLLDVYGCDPGAWTAVTLGGSGTIAMEAMLSSLVHGDDRVLIIDNGVYGQRLAQIADIHGIPHETERFPWGHEIDIQRINEQLSRGTYTYLAVVHHETTTGRLNSLAVLAGICLQHGVRLLADTVSSFGAEEIPFRHESLAACAGTANKCLHGLPGLAFVIVRNDLLAQRQPQRSLYMNLATWADKQRQSSTPFTPPVPAVLALQQALEELSSHGGWTARRARYLYLANAVEAALANAGVEPWLATGESSCVLRSYRLPSEMSYQEVHAGFKRNGFTIYGGQGNLSQHMFRISTMGDINDLDLVRLTEAIREIFQ